MEQTIKISGKDHKLKSNAMNAVIYRAAFGEDITAATNMFQSGIVNGKIIVANLDAIRMMRLVWTMEKTQNRGLKPFEEWVEEIDAFPLLDVYSETYDLVAANLTGISEIKNADAAAGDLQPKG